MIGDIKVTSKDDKTADLNTPPSPEKLQEILEQDQDVMKHAERIRAQKGLAPQDDAEPLPADESVIQTLHNEVSTLKEQVIRAHAEVENVRKQAAKQVADANKFAVSQFAKDMVMVLENLIRALENIPEDKLVEDALLKTLFDGVDMTRREVIAVFDRFGITRLDPVGEPFDHNLHQAVAHVESTEQLPEHVLQVIQAGYVLKGRLLRPAMVVVAKAPQADVPEEPNQEE
jgi:molecular chaperone GrpE